MTDTKLKPCPFCGGEAESDAMQGYRNISTGNLENQVAIYCTNCEVHMTMCHRDHQDTTIEDMCWMLAQAWNKRV